MQLATERTRLYVEGVRAAITADVARRRDDGMIVSQALPFLRLDTPVRGDDGARARIARVAIAMEGDVPRLMLELVRDEPPPLEAPAAAPDRDDTIESFTPGVSMRPARTDSTVPYDFHRREHEEGPVLAVREPEPEPTALAPARREPWWAALARRVRAFFFVLTRRAFAS